MPIDARSLRLSLVVAAPIRLVAISNTLLLLCLFDGLLQTRQVLSCCFNRRFIAMLWFSQLDELQVSAQVEGR